MRQRLSVQTIGGTSENPPSITEKSSAVSASAGPGSQIRNDHDVEFEPFGLVHRKDAHHLVFLAKSLRFRLADARVVSALVQITNDVVQRRGALPRKLARDFDQLSDVGHALTAVSLGHHDDIKVGFPNHILKDLGCSGRVPSSDPIRQDLLVAAGFMPARARVGRGNELVESHPHKRRGKDRRA